MSDSSLPLNTAKRTEAGAEHRASFSRDKEEFSFLDSPDEEQATLLRLKEDDPPDAGRPRRLFQRLAEIEEIERLDGPHPLLSPDKTVLYSQSDTFRECAKIIVSRERQTVARQQDDDGLSSFSFCDKTPLPTHGKLDANENDIRMMNKQLFSNSLQEGTRVRCTSFPATSSAPSSRHRRESGGVGVLTQNSYRENVISQSPAVSFLSQFAASDFDLEESSPTTLDSMGTHDSPGGPCSHRIKENYIIDHYLVGRLLGQSNYSECREAYPIYSKPNMQSPTASLDASLPEPVVLKIAKNCFDESNTMYSFEAELNIWKTLSHPNIIPLLEVIYFKDYPIAVSPLASQGNLLHYINDHRASLHTSKVKTIFKQIVNGLAYLHKVKRLVHRDIKLDNILVAKDDRVYIGDFGLSESFDSFISEAEYPKLLMGNKKRNEAMFCVCQKSDTDHRHHQPTETPLSFLSSSSLSDSETATSVQSAPVSPSMHGTFGSGISSKFAAGTLWYMSPESLNPSAISYRPCLCSRLLVGHKGDIWSLGIVFYALLSGQLPFFDEFIPRLQMKILKGSYQALPDHFSCEIKHLLSGMLCTDWIKRFDIDDILTHEWILDAN